MGIHGGTETFTVTTGSFTTVSSGAIDLPKKGELFSATIIANAQSTPPFAVVTYLVLNDPGASVTLRITDLCGTVRGDASYDPGTDGLDWIGRLPLGSTRNTLIFLINNDSGSTIVAKAGWGSVD